MTAARPPAACSVVELRRYRLHPGRRDELIALFDREFVESQEAVGVRVIGQFRDPGAPDDFVWLRGFADMTARKAALAAFYGGPVWHTHRSAANATMISSDDVLLLRPAGGTTWSPPAGERPPATADGDGAGAVLVTIWPLGTAAPGDLGTPLVTLVTEPSRRAGSRRVRSPDPDRAFAPARLRDGSPGTLDRGGHRGAQLGVGWAALTTAHRTE